MIGRGGTRPFIPTRREGAGPAGCSAPGLRALIDPAAAAPLLSPSVSGGRLGAPSGAGEPALPFAATAAISVFAGREGGRGLAAAAGAGFSPGTVLSLLSFSSSARCCCLPPAPSLRSPGPGGERKGRRGAGEAAGWTRVWRQLLPDLCIPTSRVLAGPASAAAAAAAGRGLEEAGAALRGRDRPSRR